jgi:hypothetical protein
VYSPTYDVWLVAFFVLLPVARRLWISYCLVDLAVYVVVMGAFHGFGSREIAHVVLPYLVVARLLTIGAFVAFALRPGEGAPASRVALARPHPGRRAVPPVALR